LIIILSWILVHISKLLAFCDHLLLIRINLSVGLHVLMVSKNRSVELIVVVFIGTIFEIFDCLFRNFSLVLKLIKDDCFHFGLLYLLF